MANPIEVSRFNGFQGFRVLADIGTPGVLDEADTVIDAANRPVAWDDPAFAAARQAFQLNEIALRLSSAMLTSATCALRPIHTTMQRRQCARVSLPADGEATARGARTAAIAIAEDRAASLRQRVDGLATGSAAEILLAEKAYLTKLSLASDSFGHIREAQRLAPQDPEIAAGYAMACLSIHGSGMAQRHFDVSASAELARLAPVLAVFRGNLRAQMVLATVLKVLTNDNAMTPPLRALGNGLDARIATMRARDPEMAEEVDDGLTTLRAHASDIPA